MNDRAIARGNQVDDLAHGCGFLITGHDENSRGDPARVACLIEESPDITGLVLIIEISSNIHLVHRRPPLIRPYFQGTRG